MSAGPVPPPPKLPDVGIDASSVSPSTWDRFSHWASENKAIVYTVGAVAVVATGAGVFYYLKQDTASSSKGAGIADRKRSKKDRRKLKKDVEEATSEPAPRTSDEKGRSE